LVNVPPYRPCGKNQVGSARSRQRGMVSAAECGFGGKQYLDDRDAAAGEALLTGLRVQLQYKVGPVVGDGETVVSDPTAATVWPSPRPTKTNKVGVKGSGCKHTPGLRQQHEHALLHVVFVGTQLFVQETNQGHVRAPAALHPGQRAYRLLVARVSSRIQ
jgi:hypothetical protein